MNKSKRQMTAQLKKKMNKELRAAAPRKEPTPKSDSIKARDLLSRVPPKVRKKEAAALKSFEKTLKVKQVKRTARHAKRATSGTVDEQSAPQSVHVEGRRWVKTLNEQTSAKRKVFTRQMAKKKR